MRIEGDEPKRRANLQKHGVDFRDAVEIFAGPLWVEPDARKDYAEVRSRGIGFNKSRLMVLVEPSAKWFLRGGPGEFFIRVPPPSP